MAMRETNLEQAPTVDLVKELTADASLLIQRQVKLATLEAKTELQRAVKLAQLFSIAGAAAYAGIILALAGAGIAIGAAIGHGLELGLFILAAALILPAAVGGLVGYRRAKQIEPLRRSRAELAKEIQWTRTLT
jgi:hypothetical protein